MLESLNIENIAVIEKAALDFEAGLNVLTGETGAGKSIIIDSINAVLGERTSRDLVRTGASAGTVSAYFTNVSADTTALLAKYDLPAEADSALLVGRKITADGKSSAKINGAPVTATILKEIGRTLINIHGQHDSQALLNPEMHYLFIDMLLPHRHYTEQYQAAFRSLIEVRRQIKALSADEAEKDRQTDLLTYQIEEIRQAEIQIGERAALLLRREQILNSASIIAAVQTAAVCLEGTDETPGVLAAFSSACKAVESASKHDTDLAALLTKMYDTLYCSESYKDILHDKLQQMEFDPEEQEQIEQRLDQLHRLSVKYGGTEEAILEFLAQAEQTLQKLTSAEEELQRLTVKYQSLLEKTVQLADTLSEARRTAAAAFEKQVQEELTYLDMPAVTFRANFQKGKLGQFGYDELCFLISTNPGEPLKHLNKVASGGELSRIMLAIKNIIARSDNIGTLIFDEIDTGVSGNASQKIGKKLNSVSQNCQVLCVTHSAQIASYAKRHLLITKQIRDGRTYTDVTALSPAGRVSELARIMGGDHAGPALIASAKEMLKQNLEEV